MKCYVNIIFDMCSLYVGVLVAYQKKSYVFATNLILQVHLECLGQVPPYG